MAKWGGLPPGPSVYRNSSLSRRNVALSTASGRHLPQDTVICRKLSVPAATQGCVAVSNDVLPGLLHVCRNSTLSAAMLGGLPEHPLVHRESRMSAASQSCPGEGFLVYRDGWLPAGISRYLPRHLHVFSGCTVVCRDVWLSGVPPRDMLPRRVAHRNLKGRGRERRSFVAALACSPQSGKRSPWIAVLHLGSGRSVE
jgi:hypothetical protein